MATNKPRITITLDQDIYDLLKSISSISGQPMSGIVSEFLDGARPVFKSMSDTFVKIKEAKDFEKKAFIDALEDSEKVLSPIAIQALGVFDSSLKKGLGGFDE